ncbi:MAG: F0F1 ATP synthase subunit B [Candidatus Cloacimonadota bacterium]|nr:F0F1 ATP synthase subunit B [Candidatus Cloacimonadota bacterium]
MISIDYSLIIVILNFVLLLIVLNKILYKPIKKFLGERQQKIASDLDEAKASQTQAEKLVEQKNDELKQSAEEIRKMKNAATSDAEGKAKDIMKNAKEQEKRILQDTEEQLETEKVKVMEIIEDELTEMVAELSSKFLSEKFDEKKDKELIKKIISERGSK